MAGWLGIETRSRGWKWLSQGSQDPKREKAGFDHARNWGTWTGLYNDFVRTEAKDRLIRCLKDAEGQPYCRAILSAGYEIIPNHDWFMAVVEALDEVRAEVWHCRLTDDSFKVYAVAPGITAQVRTDRTFDPGDGWRSRWFGKEGDVMNAACCGGNSETGEGGCGLSAAVLRRVCENYCVWQEGVTKVHIGKRHATDSVLSDETLAHRNRWFFGQLRDYVRTVFDPDRFGKMIEIMNRASQEVVADPDKAGEALMLCYDISAERAEAIRRRFDRNLDRSVFGLANAVTESAHADEDDPDAGFGLEQLGTELLSVTGDGLFSRLEKVKRERGLLEPAGA
jgi:hypothetical protein